MVLSPKPFYLVTGC